MRLETFLLADHAAATADGKLYINGGGITEFNVHTLPVVIAALSLVLRFAVDEEDIGDHTFELAFEDPQGRDIIGRQPAPLTVQPPMGQPESEKYMQAAVTFGPILIASEGVFKLTLFIDGEPVRTMHLPSKMAPPAQPLVQDLTTEPSTAGGQSPG